MTDLRYTVSVVLSNCYLPSPVEFTSDARVLQLPNALGFRGEADYVLELCSALEIPLADDFPDSLRETVADTEHAALLQVQGLHAKSPEEAEEKLRDWIDRVCDTLSIVTTNAITPIAILMSPNDQREGTVIRLLPPPESQILLGYHDAGRTLSRAEIDPAYAVLCRVFRIAQQARRSDFRIFHYGQVLELASDNYPGDKLRTRIDSFLTSVALPPTAFSPLDQLASDADAAHALANLRNAMAHGGKIDTTTVDPKFHVLLADLDHLAHGIRELLRAVLAALA